MLEGTIAFTWIMPLPWPPAGTIHLFSQAGFRLEANADGRLVLWLRRPGHSVKAFSSQRLWIDKFTRIRLAVTWDAQDVNYFVNGERISAEDDTAGIIRVPNSMGGPPTHPSGDPWTFPIDTTKGQTAEEKIFLCVLDDLKGKVLNSSDYGLLKASGLLRQLFMDAYPLIHAANRGHRLKFSFERSIVLPGVGSPKTQWYSLDRGNMLVDSLDLDGFIASVVVVDGPERGTVGDLIKAMANAGGGVHFGRPKRGGETVVMELDNLYIFMEKAPSLHAIVQISRVAIRGLRSLVEAIESQATSQEVP